MSEAEGSAEYDIDDGDEVWLGDRAVAGDEFVEALETVHDFQESIRTLQDDLRKMNVGLDREDAVNLLWGRTSMNKSQILAAFEVFDAIVEEDPENVAPRLMADQSTELTISEAAEVFDDMVELADKYGTSDENE